MVKNYILWMIVALLAAACTPGSLPRPWQTGSVVLTQVPDYGAGAARELVQSHGGALNDEIVQNYLEQLVGQLAVFDGYHGQPWTVQVVNDSACELLSVPGDFLLVYRGFLNAVTSESELAAILGHEMAHLRLGHLAQSALDLGVFDHPGRVLGDRAEDAIRSQQLADFVAQQHYSIAQEKQASEFWRNQVGVDGEADALTASLATSGWILRHPNGVDVVLPVLSIHPPVETVTFNDMKSALDAMAAGYAVFDQGVAEERQDHLPQAIALYLQAATQAPEQSQIVTGLGLAYLKAGELNSARHHLQRAVQLDGDYYRSRLGLGYIALQQEDLEAAQTHLRYSQALLPTVQGSYLLAELYQRQGDWAQAEPLFQQVVDAAPHSTLGKAARKALKQGGRQ